MGAEYNFDFTLLNCFKYLHFAYNTNNNCAHIILQYDPIFIPHHPYKGSFIKDVLAKVTFWTAPPLHSVQQRPFG